MNEAGASCDGGTFAGWFMQLTTSCPTYGNGQPGSIGYVRFFVPWNALGTDPSGASGWSNCSWSYDANNGGAAWQTLYSDLQYAQQDRLTPMISITAGTVDGQEYGNEPLYPTVADYACGLAYLMEVTSLSNVHVPAWEVWNEPDSGQNSSDLGYVQNSSNVITGVTGSQAAIANGEMVYVDGTAKYGACSEFCATLVAGAGTSTWTLSAPVIGFSGSSPTRVRAGLPLTAHDGLSGAEGAAEYYVVATASQAEASLADNGADSSDVLAAGAFNSGSVNDPNARYEVSYINYLMGTFAEAPSLWSFHPYDDVDAAGNLGYDQSIGSYMMAHNLREAYTAYGDPMPHVWMTEAGVDLTNSASTYVGIQLGCPAVGSSPANTLGACVNGNALAQAYAAQDFMDLPGSVNSDPSYTVPVTRIYWYQFEEGPGFGSGLIAADGNLLPSYCVLDHFSPSDAATLPSCQNGSDTE